MSSSEKQFSKILVAFDGSEPSLNAVGYAADISHKNKSTLTILHVVDSYKYPYLLSSVVLAPTYGSDKFEEEKKKFEGIMVELKEKLRTGSEKDMGEGNIKTDVVEGTASAAATIVDYAEEKGIDLIVVGNRGRTGFKKMLVGSVALDVVKYAHCPVLVVR
jgi:nucleotide-binding universal stress UspA family protein